MTAEVAKSYAYATAVARTRARNFYYSFLLLPRPRRDAICAMYAFMRYCDDLSDDLAASPAQMNQWREDLSEALQGRFTPHPVWPAFYDAVQRYDIPHRYFFDMIDGVSSDLAPQSMATFDDLYRYCYRVASVVGLTIIHIFGFSSDEAPLLAEKCGIAFQITNILRDVKEDVAMGRVYLPAEDLARFGVSAADLGAPIPGDSFRELMHFEATRAREYYVSAQPLVGIVDASSRSSLWALIEIYTRLLDRIEAANYDVLSRRIGVPAWEKSWIVFRGLATRL